MIQEAGDVSARQLKSGFSQQILKGILDCFEEAKKQGEAVFASSPSPVEILIIMLLSCLLQCYLFQQF